MPLLSSPRLERHVGAGNVAAGRREDALHAGARVGRTAHDLEHARAGVDLADPQAVGVGMLHGLDHIAHDEALQGLGGVGDAFDLEPEHGEAVAHLFQRRSRIEMLLEPAQREFHRTASSAEKP
jgi:hypothetical protein